MRPHRRLLALAGLLCLPVVACAPGAGAPVDTSRGAATTVIEDVGEALDGASGASYRAVGVLRYPWIGKFCTVTYVDVGGGDGDAAVVLTNAHCLLPEYVWETSVSQVDRDRPLTSSVSFGVVLGARPAAHVTVPAKRLAYGTVLDTDLAILVLDATVGELRRRGVAPLPLAAKAPAPGMAVALVGVNLEKVPLARQVLHRTTCVTGASVHLRIDSYEMPSSVVHGCSEVAGTSGGPLIDAATGEVVLLNNAAVRDDSPGEAACSAFRPCEVGAGGQTTVRDHGRYGQEVHALRACFERGAFDADRPGCALPR